MAVNRGRRWVFTLNNYLQEELDALSTAKDSQYVLYGKEVGDEGTRHLQGFIVLKTKKRLGGVKSILPRAHWEKMKGTLKSNIEYCSKDGDITEHGEKPKLGRRSDLTE